MKYIFKGRTILIYNEDTGRVIPPLDEVGKPDIANCNLILEDFELLEVFFIRCQRHRAEGVVFEDIIVN